MKHSIRAFAVGLLTAALIMLVVNYFSNGSKQELSEMPIEDIIEELKEKGYRVLTETDYISLSMNGEVKKNETEIASETEESSTDKQETAEENQEEEANSGDESSTGDTATSNEEEQQEETVKTYTVTIQSGMAPSTISNELEANGIIDDADEFISYLEDEGYVVRIQLGDFTLTSDMSHFEIAEALTK
jgi:S-adenosylmethionine:tRNA-ribosyltransferase-isomerase (queuine synthetase)